MLQVIREQVTLSRDGNRDFYGLNQMISFQRVGGVRNSDYIEFHINGSRTTYEWCRGLEMVDFKSHGSLERSDDDVAVKYFESGGFFTSGKLLAQMNYKVRNPVTSFDLQPSQQFHDIGSDINANYEMLVVPDLCVAVVRDCNRRLASFAISTAVGHVLLQAPRITGNYEVAIIAGRNGSVLTRKNLVVQDQLHRGSVQLYVLNQKNRDGSRLIAIQPGNSITVTAIGDILQVTDEILVIRAQSSLEPPTFTSMVNPMQSHTLQQNGRNINVPFQETGIYYICLGLRYFGSRLLGDYFCVVVSALAAPGLQEADPSIAMVANQVSPYQPTTSSTTQQQPQGSGFKCIACYDSHVCMKLEPCKHVALCESCFHSINRSKERSCPICRTAIQGYEKVFVVGGQL